MAVDGRIIGLSQSEVWLGHTFRAQTYIRERVLVVFESWSSRDNMYGKAAASKAFARCEFLKPVRGQ